MVIECREMKFQVKGEITNLCPDCNGRCSALTLQPGLEICNLCQTIALIPHDAERWKPHLPMMADYVINADGSKKLLGWHPKSESITCKAIQR